MKQCDILFVEDDRSVVSLYKAFMSLTGYSFKIAFSGEEALELVDNTEFKLFIIDINLGSSQMTGIDLAITIRNRFKDAYIFAMTGYSSLFDEFSPQIAGFDGLFAKPEGYTDFLNKIKEILGN